MKAKFLKWLRGVVLLLILVSPLLMQSGCSSGTRESQPSGPAPDTDPNPGKLPEDDPVLHTEPSDEAPQP